MLTAEQRDFFDQNGYLRLEAVYPPSELEEMRAELDYVMETFCTPTKGWTGSWRKDKQYLTPEEEEKSQLISIHELQHYSAAWTRAAVNRRLAESIADLIGPAVELHHVTLHAKGADYGTPFPMHQDNPFYPHTNGQYLDAIVHVDTTNEENGCLKFLAGSHKLGPLEHIREGSPHLPPEEYRIDDAVSCPAGAGDVVLFSIYTVHGSLLNRTPRIRRLVRFGFRNPANIQVGGQALGRPGLMVLGVRPKIEGVKIDPYGLWQPQAQAATSQSAAQKAA